MAVYNESGLRLDLPDGQHFRFAELAAYKRLSGQHLKEMDFAWVADGKLYMLEVRSYAQIGSTLAGADLVAAKGAAKPHRYEALIDKITDSLLMLLAAWADTGTGQTIKADLPAVARARLPLKLIVALELPANLSVHLPALRDSLNERLRGRMALADVRNVVVVDHARLLVNPLFSAFIKTQT